MMLARYSPRSIRGSDTAIDGFPAIEVAQTMANATPIRTNSFSRITALHDHAYALKLLCQIFDHLSGSSNTGIGLTTCRLMPIANGSFWLIVLKNPGTVARESRCRNNRI
jgi:hypothetical protein